MTTPAHDRLAIVTGADSGMGKATAELLATEGFDVGITFHTDEAGAEDTRQAVEQRGRRCFVARQDQASPSTGDVVDQLADQEDPLAIRLESRHPSHRRQPKRARFASQDSLHEKGDRTLRLEDIEIPDPGPRTISKAERLLARIMAPNDGPSRIHGLHGKKLM